MGRSTETLDMKFFVVIALAGAAVASPSNRNDDDGAAAALECTAGTNIGDKLANAFSSCFGSMAGMRKEVKRIQLARNDEQCYSYDEIMQWVEEEYADDACVLQSIGWMGNDFEFDEDQIEADVMSLDPVVTAPLFAGHEDCVDQVIIKKYNFLHKEHKSTLMILHNSALKKHIMVMGYSSCLVLFIVNFFPWN